VFFYLCLSVNEVKLKIKDIILNTCVRALVCVYIHVRLLRVMCGVRHSAFVFYVFACVSVRLCAFVCLCVFVCVCVFASICVCFICLHVLL